MDEGIEALGYYYREIGYCEGIFAGCENVTTKRFYYSLLVDLLRECGEDDGIERYRDELMEDIERSLERHVEWESDEFGSSVGDLGRDSVSDWRVMGGSLEGSLDILVDLEESSRLIRERGMGNWERN